MRRKQRLELRNERIRQEFDLKVNQERLQMDYVCAKLAEKYTLDPNTIYLIVKRIGAYASDNENVTNNNKANE